MTDAPPALGEDIGTADYLDAFIAPLRPHLDRRDVTDIFINGDARAWIETLDGSVRAIDTPDLSEAWLWQLAKQVARHSSQAISRASPLLGARLPDGVRVQIVAPPATRHGIAAAFRKQAVTALRLDDYDAAGSFPSGAPAADDGEADLATAYARHDYVRFLRDATRRRKTILIAGGTGSGKTTFANALIQEIPAGERLIVIEDTPELEPPHRNMLGLVAARSELGEAQVSSDDLLQAALRMRPDRLILGELRGAEAFTFLRAVSTGHPGSISTIHADSPDHALDQLALLVLQSGIRLEWSEVRRYVAGLIDVSVQLRRGAGGRRVEQVVWHRRAPGHATG